MNLVYLTRRNLETLLAKLDRAKTNEITECAIVKNDTTHKEFPATVPMLFIVAVEDEVYYTDRKPGLVYEDGIA